MICVIDPDPSYFVQAVRSILDQTLEDLELIIIEEPSSRDGRELLADIPDRRLRHFMHDERTHLIHQRNRGIEHARSDLIAVLDADDIAEPDRLEKQVSFMTSHPEVGVLGTQLRLIDPAGAPIGYREYPVQPDAVAAALRRFNPIGQPAVMYRKSVVESVGAYTYSKYPATEDYDLWCKVHRAGIAQANLNEALVRYRIHPGGMKSTKLRGILRGTIEIKEKYFGHQLDVGDRARLLGERVLLRLPPPLVMKLFLWSMVRAQVPGRGAT